MRSPGREVVVEERKMDTHSVDGQSEGRSQSQYIRSPGSGSLGSLGYRGTGHGTVERVVRTSVTDAREHDGQRPRRHLPSSLRAKVVVILPCACVL